MTINKNILLANIGHWMRDHKFAIQLIQWCIVGVYAFLIIVPLFLPIPDEHAHLWSNLTLIAQFAFWGIWWPFVLVSMVLLGRVWCGVLCPEGALTEFASRFGRGWSVPRWMRWGGWPFVAFVLTTVYGQLVSVYQYPKAVMLVLGGSTIGAMIIGYFYGRDKRVWCRYLCPVNGVFNLLAKLAPIHYKVNDDAWKASYQQPKEKIGQVNCAPLVPMRQLDSASQCHMCGRCSGYRQAITLEARPMTQEIVQLSKQNNTSWDSLLVLFGLLGVAIGAFHWTVSPWFIAYKQNLATWLINHNVMWPFDTDHVAWWMLTHYPENNDVFSWLDGFCVLTYILMTATVMGCLLSLCMRVSSYALQQNHRAAFNQLTLAFIPIAACGVFLGLSATTVSLLRAEHYSLYWVNDVRAVLLAVSALATIWLSYKVIATYAVSVKLKLIALVPILLAVSLIVYAWLLMFWIW